VKRFLLYCIGGGLAVVAHYAVLIMLVELFDWRSVWASMLGFLAAAPINFSFQRMLVFKTLDNVSIRLRRYFIAASATFLLNGWIFYLFVEWANIQYLVAQALTIILLLIVNYWVNTTWTFKALRLGH